MIKVVGSLIGGLVIAFLMFMVWNGFSLKDTLPDIKKNFWLWVIAVLFLAFLIWLILLEGGVWGYSKSH